MIKTNNSFTTSVLVAQTPGCYAYGSDAYNDPSCTYSGVNGSSDSGGLANTGYDILIPAAFGVAVLGASIIYFVRRFLRTRKAAKLTS